MSDLILNKEIYKFKNDIYPPKIQCPYNFNKCPCN